MSPRFRAGLHALLLVAAVLALSTLSMKVWGGRPERAATRIALEVRPEMTIAEIGQRNRLPRSVLQRAFDLHSADELKRPLAWTGLSVPAAIERLHRARALEAEAGSKNWQKIVLKFALWIAFLGVVLTLLRRRRVTPARRRVLYGVAVALFGVTLGADPSPMGTVKDALVLYGRSHVVFPPRMIALGVFLLLVILANKLICSWGCQAGTLQDLLFRIGRDPGDRRSLWPQLRPPFWLANGVRVTFFVLLVAGAFLWAVDVVEPLDPFKVFKPTALGIVGGLAVGAVLVASLFVYRPWCHFLCPFGLVGWVAEQVSIVRIRVSYDRCIGCQACARACPSTVMTAILTREHRTIPDCFACGACLTACPTGAVSFTAGRRERPPGGWAAFRETCRSRQGAASRPGQGIDP